MCVHACILKNTGSLGCVPAKLLGKKKEKVICLRKAYFVEFTFFFPPTQKSVIVFLIAEPIRNHLCVCLSVKVVVVGGGTYRTHTHTGNVCLAACLYLCVRVCALLCSSFVFGDHLQLSTIL